MILYRSNITDRIIPGETMTRVVGDIWGCYMLEGLLSTNVIEEVKNPTVFECLRCGSKIAAVRFYMETHHCGISQAYAKVNLIEKDMERFKQRNAKKGMQKGCAVK